MVGKTFINTSGKRVQVPNRITDAFCWQPNEKITIITDLNTSPSENGYIVHNLNYVGPHIAHENSWIDDKTLKENFKELCTI